MIDVDASDVLACGGFLPERVAPRTLGGEKLEILNSKSEAGKLEALSSKSEVEGGTGAARGAWIQDVGGTGACGGGLVHVFGPRDPGDCLDEPMSCNRLADCAESSEGESISAGGPAAGADDDLTSADEETDPQNDTNEPKCDDDVLISETQEVDRLISEIDDYFGLDPGKTKPNSGGGTSNSARRPRTDADGGGAVPTGREAKILEMERWLFQEIEHLKSQGETTGDLFNDMMAASANLHAYLKTYHSRSP